MEMKGEYVIPVSKERVWAALNDPVVLKAAIPGCDELTQLSPTDIEATVTAKVGPVKASFKGAVTLSDLDPPNGYSIRGEGKGGAAGFAKGGAKVRLTDALGGTLLTYEVDAAVGGKLAQIGGRLIDATAKKLADEFFERFSKLAAESR
jgi:carbon monoxide dehydrogenase subunit G